jgi:CRISPR system Cascade subunit CasE
VGRAGAHRTRRVVSLTLLRLRPDLAGLAQAAARRGLLPPGGDLGYALHAALAALFGAAAPRPFVLRETPDGPELLAYCATPPDELRTLAALPPTGEATDLAEPLRPESAAARSMPATWTPGQRLGFSVRVRPVVRTRPGGRDGPHREHDAFAHLRRRASGAEPLPPREGVYRDWLARILSRDDAATLESSVLIAYRSTRVLRRPLAGEGRRPAVIEGPDATLAGVLAVKDAAAFSRLLARGVGRHCGFGFGMLLLAPPGRRPAC